MRRRAARPRGALLLLAVVVLPGCAGSTPEPAAEPPASAEQACEAPRATAEPERIRMGESITVTGAAWQPCDDAIGVDEAGQSSDGVDLTAWSVTITWAQAGERVELGQVEPVDGAFEREVTVPASAIAGEAMIELTSPDYEPGLALGVRVEQ